MTVKEVAEAMLDCDSKEREIAEIVIGKPFETMTPEERGLAAEFIAAFYAVL